MIQGGFDDLTALTPIHSPVVPFGLRSKQNWGLCPVQPRHRLRRWARTAAATTRYSIFCVRSMPPPANIDAFVDRARQINQTFGEPMIDSRVIVPLKADEIGRRPMFPTG
jgi:hypothetical protein